MATARSFKSGNSMALRVPRPVALEPGEEFEVERRADGVIEFRPLRRKIDVTGFAGSITAEQAASWRDAIARNRREAMFDPPIEPIAPEAA